eukprot:gnl/MRDRNA2_/MRDRNA2_115136_c0_seq1.p1 gnl/MRDRNA2_/MRDRNA2_115136_c0~~gnl/MRDRNA2_/MRDRNA2_115136_c0_seq1.p1  ORF type:complete len:322 (-),score=89.85 gnl/MRDRNA2_/MRDRNA2_115136_c0_seq1:169-1086(-)
MSLEEALQREEVLKAFIQRQEKELAEQNASARDLARSCAKWEERCKAAERQVENFTNESATVAEVVKNLSRRFEEEKNRTAALKEQLASFQIEIPELHRRLAEAEALAADRQEAIQRAEGAEAQLLQTQQELEHFKKRSRHALDLMQNRSQEHTDRARNEVRKQLEGNADLGRKVVACRGEIQHWQNVAAMWQKRHADAEFQLMRMQHELQVGWDVAHRSKMELSRVEAERQGLEEAKDAAEASSREIREWLQTSLAEVNRSAHVPVDRHAPIVGPGFVGEQVVDILESFRLNQQMRIGYGTRTR